MTGAPDLASTPAGAGVGGPGRPPRPSRVDVTRTDVRPLSFGAGIHHCIGAALARLEAQEVVAELAATCRDLELGAEPVWDPFVQVRRMASVPLALRSRGPMP